MRFFGLRCLRIFMPCVFLFGVPVAAQSTKLGLLPGHGENYLNWQSTVSTLNGSGLQIGALFTPSPSTSAAIPVQLSSVLSGYGSEVGMNTILIGHSNGGIVARLASQGQTLLGTATIGTPNQGLPAETNADELAGYGSDMLWDALVTINDFSTGDYYWLLDNVFVFAYYWYVQVGGGMEQVESWAGMGTQAANEVHIGSPFLTDTANGHVITELSNATTSVGVVVTAENYYYGGPLRLVSDASAAYDWSIAINGLGAGLLGAAQYIYDNSYPMTDQNYREVEDLDVLADLLFYVELVWCSGVTEPHYFDPWMLHCGDNDGFIGTLYQTRPGAATPINWTDAKAHLSETEEGDRIVTLLNQTFGIPF